MTGPTGALLPGISPRHLPLRQLGVIEQCQLKRPANGQHVLFRED
jgi:hypothetical protein